MRKAGLEEHEHETEGRSIMKLHYAHVATLMAENVNGQNSYNKNQELTQRPTRQKIKNLQKSLNFS